MKKFKVNIETEEDNPILRKKSEVVRDFAGITPTGELKLGEFVQEMKKVLDNEKGLGLAAPQVGENIRLILCRLNAGTSSEVVFVMVNPEVIERSDGLGEEDRAVWDPSWGEVKRGAVSPDGKVEVDEEGCLSLPNYYVNVVRAREIVVKFLDGGVLLKKGKGFRGNGPDGGLNQMVLKLEGLNARVIQHEIDHLNAVMICDKVV
ncbi:peptide deformylase [Candidatus Peregrinibacteria bacterium]|nr:peptide deformylase [Candidatus Peregrinibacteria bacterium]